MDMLEVGRGLTEDEEKTHFGIWSILSSPLMIGCDLRTIPEKTLSIITNKEVIALNQDSLGLQAEAIERGKDYLILSKAIQKREGKLRAVALYNRSNTDQQIRVDFDKLYLSGDVRVRDLWNHQEMGTFTDYYETLVPAHGTALICFHARISARQQTGSSFYTKIRSLRRIYYEKSWKFTFQLGRIQKRVY